ncbi:MAG: MFS transporter [Betaproteobacteria bacterium]|nr:MFS transporter [Betaproteobacteria bacterium]
MMNAAPRSFAALHNRSYRSFFLGAALLMMADSIEHVISYWIMFEKFQSPALGGFAVVSHWLPFLLFSVWSGALADRFDPRRMIQLGMAFFMAASIAWGVLILTDSLQIWHAAVLLVLHGIAGVLWSPAAQIYIHNLVDESELHSAIRLTATSRWLGLLMGPGVGGVVLLVFGAGWGILFNAALYLPFMLWLWKAPLREKTTSSVRRVRGLADIVATMREIAGNRIIVSMTMLAGGASLLVGNAYQAQIPEFAHHLGHSDGGFTYSALLAADAAGALSAGLLLEGRGLLEAKPRSAFILAMLWCMAIAAFALSNSYAFSLAILFAAGFLELSFNAMAQTLVQIHAPAESRGRVIGLFAMASLGLRAFAGVTVGLGGALVGIHWSLALSAMALLAVTMALLAFTMKTRIRT